MAIIDVVKYEQKEGELVHRFPSCDLRWGTQLVVYPGQVAFFMKGGKLCDQFLEGTYTLHTNNVPLLNKLINIPFGGESPFQADVWFVNLLTKLDLKWGTETPIQLEDPKYKIIVPVRAYGQYGMRIHNAKQFVSRLVGNKISFDEYDFQSYFRGILLSQLTGIVSQKIINDEISILDINTKLYDISSFCESEIKPSFEQYGIEVVNFTIISINVPENDKSLDVIKNAKSYAARLQITGTENYKMERTFDVMDAAAKNESNGGNMMNAGIGLAAGMGFGNKMMDSIEVRSTTTTPPPLPSPSIYYLAINEKQMGPFSIEQIIEAIKSNPQIIDELCWKTGMKSWEPLRNFDEFQSLGVVPPPINNNQT